jgi:predicted AAA+ superfamily ATPase
MATTPITAPATYRRRIVDDVLDELMAGLPAIAVEGLKAVGKTATAAQRAQTAYPLDDPDQRAIAAADLDRLLAAPTPALIDEWQNVPPVWDRVRRAVDAGAPPGSFLLTGSASPKDTGTHSGGGRIVSLRMRPLSLAERWPGEATVSLAELLRGGRPAIVGRTSRRLEDYTEEILRSGFPGLRGLRGRPLRAQLDSYLQRVVDRDFAELGYMLRNQEGLLRWMRAYAAATSGTASYEKIRRAAVGRNEPPVSRNAAAPYREVLERLFQLDPVAAWAPTGSHLNRVTLPDKHQLSDPALAARLLRVGEGDLLQGTGPALLTPKDGGLLGALFESLVTLSVRVYADAAEATLGHFRAYGGEREVDLIVKGESGRVIAIEVKLAATPSERDGRHLKWLEREIGDELLDKVIITTGRNAYRREDGIAVVPAALLGP